MSPIQVARKSTTKETRVTLSAGFNTLVEADKDRTRIIFCPGDIAGPTLYTLSTIQDPAAGEAIGLVAGDPPFVIDIETYGDAVTKKWYCTASGAGDTITVFEVSTDYLPEE